jgi:hypothetical protein
LRALGKCIWGIDKILTSCNIFAILSVDISDKVSDFETSILPELSTRFRPGFSREIVQSIKIHKILQ